jgi:hypothetical protein
MNSTHPLAKRLAAYCAGSGKRAKQFGTDTCPACGKTYTVTGGLEIRKHVSAEGRARAAAFAADQPLAAPVSGKSVTEGK